MASDQANAAIESAFYDHEAMLQQEVGTESHALPMELRGILHKPPLLRTDEEVQAL